MNKPNKIEDMLGNLKLSSSLHNETKKSITVFLKESLKRIKSISKNYGLEFNFSFEFVIVSSKEKYLFNYLSGAFGNKNLKNGAQEIFEFYRSPRFMRIIKNLSGRAISDPNVINKASKSLNHFVDIYGNGKEKTFISSMKYLCGYCRKILTNKGNIILIGIPQKWKVKPFDKLLAHELFHLLLINNGIWFQKINDKYDYLDENLATFLSLEFSKERRDKNYWFKILSPLKGKEKANKIREIYKELP